MSKNWLSPKAWKVPNSRSYRGRPAKGTLGKLFNFSNVTPKVQTNGVEKATKTVTRKFYLDDGITELRVLKLNDHEGGR